MTVYEAYIYLCLFLIPLFYITYLYEIKYHRYEFKFIILAALTLSSFVPIINLIIFVICVYELFTEPFIKLEGIITRFIRGKNDSI